MWVTIKSTYHDLRHCKEYREERGECTVTILHASFTLQAPSVHPHVPVGEFVDELHQARHNGVQTIRCRQIQHINVFWPTPFLSTGQYTMIIS